MRIYAHRGSHRPGGPRENTLAAFDAAVREGADAIETDLWASRDGEIFLFHDDTLATATGGRERRAVPDMTAAEVRRVVLANGERIPSLHEALEVVARRVGWNLELKHTGALAATLSAIRAHRLGDEVLLSSFVLDAMVAARAEAPGVARAVIMGTPRFHVRVRLREAFPFGWLKRASATHWHPHHALVNRAIVKTLHRQGVRINVWTVNDARTARALVRLGADGLFTDRPGALRDELG